MTKIIDLAVILGLILSSCVGATQKKEAGGEELPPLQAYMSYTVDSVFDSQRFLTSASGDWVCYKYEKDTGRIKYPHFSYDESRAMELQKYYSFSIGNDTLTVNSLFSIPIYSYSRNIESLGRSNRESFLIFSGSIDGSNEMDIVYRIGPKDGLRYKELADSLIGQGDTVSYYSFVKDPMTSVLWCFPDVIALYFEGYNYYFKKGEPNNEGIVGIPSDQNNRFIVNRIYESCSIEEAAYKLIEDFPYGTEGLLFPSDENSDPEPFFSHTSLDLYATVYDWRSQDELIVRALRNRNCTFVFEFKQMGDDVYVKYWNDVVFPYEEDYQWP